MKCSADGETAAQRLCFKDTAEGRVVFTKYAKHVSKS